MDIHCPTCGKPITVSEQHYNQEVNCPGCDQSLFLEKPEEQVEPPTDEITSTVSEELQPATETEVQQETGHQDPMGNKVASVLGKIIGGVILGLGILVVFGQVLRISSGYDIGNYIVTFGCPLFLLTFGWIVLMRARK